MLELLNVKKSYRQNDEHPTEVLDVDKYQIGQGEQVVMLGPSGCGKTTILHTIAGIIQPDQGKVTLDGIDICRLTQESVDRVRADKIGYVFQTFNLMQGFTALENVLLGMSFSRKRPDRDRAKSLLEKVGLGHRLHHKPSAMSVGEQQRTAVARALGNQPKIILADEPTANVDPGNQQVIVNLLRKSCKEENISLLIVTHDMDVANQFERIDRLDEINRVVAKNRLADHQLSESKSANKNLGSSSGLKSKGNQGEKK